MPEIYLHTVGHVLQKQSFNCLFQTFTVFKNPSFLHYLQIETSLGKEKEAHAWKDSLSA